MIWTIYLIGAILRLTSLNQSLWLDEAINTLAVKNYSLHDIVGQYARADFHPPGHFILLWFWTKIFGYSEIAVRIPSVVFGLLTIWITFLIGKKIFSKRVGLVSATLIALNPLHIYYSQEARMYAMAALAVAINIFLLIKLVKGEKLKLIYLVLSNIFILASDYLAYFIFPAQFIFLLLYKKELFKKWFLALTASVISGIWWLPIFLGQLDVGAQTSANLPTWKFIVGGFEFKKIPLTFVKFIIGKISIADKFVYALVLLPVCTLFGYLIFRAFIISQQFVRILFVSWIVIPILLALIISIFVPIYDYFRVLFVVPGFIIVMAVGITSFKTKLQTLFLVTVLIIQLSSSTIYLSDPAFQREDWRGVVNFLLTQEKSTILFESSGTLPPFDYYAQKKLNAKGGLKDFPAKEENDIIDLNSLEKNVYLIEYLVEISDRERLLTKKLKEAGYTLSDTKNFTGVGFIYHYVKE